MSQQSIRKFLEPSKKSNLLDVCESKVSVPEQFPFPYEPYPIQVDFMKALYSSIEQGKLAIFESPTGTGKSLSLICGALKWLQDHENKLKQDLKDGIQKLKETRDSQKENSSNGFSWIDDYSKQKEQSDQLRDITVRYEQLEKREQRIQDLKSKRQKTFVAISEEEELEAIMKELKQVKEDLVREVKENDDDDEFLIREDVFEDDFTISNEKDCDDTQQDSDVTQIFYCSRTHSQLTQFVQEIQKSLFAKDVRVVSLASRQSLCINESVMKLKSVSMINDRCLELQKDKKGKSTKLSDEGEVLKKRKGSNGCPYFRQAGLDAVRDNSLIRIRDIEQLVDLGKKFKACPYYASRSAVPDAQLVVVPYNTILHKSTRDACGIKLKGNVVIIDEAHNLIDTIANIHSTEITISQMSCALSQLKQYQTRFSTKLTAKNLYFINQLIFIIDSILSQITGFVNSENATPASDAKDSSKLYSPACFLTDTGIDNINIFELLNYITRSDIARKLLGFVEKFEMTDVGKEQQSMFSFLKELTENKKKGAKVTAKCTGKNEDSKSSKDGRKSPPTSPLRNIQEFLQALTNEDKDGRVLLTKKHPLNASSLKYYLLNPSIHFKSIITEARAVIVAGGTMHPISEFTDQLFKIVGAPDERISYFGCGHVIPAKNILPIILTHGPGDKQLDFTYTNRNSDAMMDEVGRILVNVCNVVPGGIVCFFPSYNFLEKVHSYWQESKITEKLSAKKQLFTEPKKANQVEAMLSEYGNCIKRLCANVMFDGVRDCNCVLSFLQTCSSSKSKISGALLSAVVGGKMSEGINFSDDLGRCVVMVGMPYPNVNSVELQEKMNHLNMKMSKGADGRLAGQVHYESLCMKAVNQSIGRAIRHSKDYATILLLDQRYSRHTVQSGLATWIRNQVVTFPKFGPAIGAVSKFFKARQDENLPG